MDVISQIYTDEGGKKWACILLPLWFTLDEHVDDVRQKTEDVVRNFWHEQELNVSEVPCDEGAGQNGTHEEAQPSEQETSGDQGRYGETEQ